MMQTGVDCNSVLPHSGLRKRLIDGLLWSVANAVSCQGITFFLNIIIANLLGRSAFGKFGILQSTFLTFVGVAQLATGYAANKYVAEFRQSDKERASRLIALFSLVAAITGCIAGVLLLFGAPFISGGLRDPELTRSFVILSFAVFFGVVNGCQMGVLAGLESYFEIARTGILTGLLNLIVCSIAAWLFNLEGVVVALALNTFLQWFLYRGVFKREIRKHGISLLAKDIRQEGHVFFRFLLPAALSGCVSMPALWVANVILVRSSDGFNQMALYSAANTIRTLIIYLPTILNKVTASLLNNQKGLNDQQRYQKVFWFNVIITIGGVVLGVVVVAFLGKWILGVFGKDFKEGYSVLMVMLLATIFETTAAAFCQVFQAQEKMWLVLFGIAIPRDSLIILLSCFLIPSYGALGAAWAYATGWFLAMGVTVFFSLRINRRTSLEYAI